jgi:phosphoglycerate kinase
MQKLSVQGINLKGKKALIRVDFNVPLDHGQVADDTRIRASLPTIQHVLKQGGAAILMSHLGRPKGKPTPEFSLAPCAKHLAALLGRPVQMAPDCVGLEVEKMAQALKPGDVLLLENLRFHKGEEEPKQEPGFVNALARLGDVYINDAFGSAHRAHASTTLLAQFFPGQAAAGFLMEKEIAYLGQHLLNPKHPFCAILGGAKISTKFKVIEVLMQKADVLLIGGAMATTFFQAQGISIGSSLCEPDFIGVARQLLEVDMEPRARIVLPIDVVVAKSLDSKEGMQVIDIKAGVPEGLQIVDIGPKTIEIFAQEMQQAALIFWNGPLGVYEFAPFAKGTQAIAATLANQAAATTIVGGGDSIAAIEAAGMTDRISHISTGGGASLELVELGTLPGIDALTNS